MNASPGRTRAGRIGRLASLGALLLAATASTRPPSHVLKVFNDTNRYIQCLRDKEMFRGDKHISPLNIFLRDT